MDRRKVSAYVFVALMLTTPLAGFVSAQGADAGGQVSDAQGDPAGYPGRKGAQAENATTDLGDLVIETREGQEELIFAESFEGPQSLAERGWSESRFKREAPRDAWRIVERDPAADYQPGRTPVVVRDGSHALGLLPPNKNAYPGGLANRVETPVIDLRYVSGAGGDTDEARSATGLAGLLESAAEILAKGTVQRGPVGMLDFLRSVVLLEPSDLPLTQERYGAGLVNLTFWHAYNFEPRDGGYLEVRYEVDGRWSAWEHLGGDLVFEPSRDASAFRNGNPFCSPVSQSSTDQTARTADIVDNLLFSGTDPEKRRARQVVQTYQHACDPSTVFDRTIYCAWLNPVSVADCETSIKDGIPLLTGYNPLTDPQSGSFIAPSVTTLLNRVLHNEQIDYYNGHTNYTAEFGKPDYQRGTEAFVGSSGGVVKSQFTLNRFIGTRIQLAFRVHGDHAAPALGGWFIDTVRVTALVPRHDVGVRDVVAPTHGDVIAPGTWFHPTALVSNFGNRSMHDIQVTFQINESGVGEVFKETVLLSKLDRQETRRVAGTTPFRPERIGWYGMNITVAPAGDALNLTTFRTAEDTVHENNVAIAIFRVVAVEDVRVALTIPKDAIQTDLGEPKRGLTVQVANHGNFNLTGTVFLNATPVDRETSLPIGPPIPINAARLFPADIPYTKTLTNLGMNAPPAERKFDWTHGLENEGMYTLTAEFASDVSGRSTRTSLPIFVRMTPTPSLLERFAPKIVPEGLAVDDLRSQSGWKTWGYSNASDEPRLTNFNFSFELNNGAVSGTGAWMVIPTFGESGLNNATGRGKHCPPLTVREYPIGGPSTCESPFSIFADGLVFRGLYLSPFDHLHSYALAFDLDLTSIPQNSPGKVELSFWSWSAFDWKLPPAAVLNTSTRGIVDVQPWFSNDNPGPALRPRVSELTLGLTSGTILEDQGSRLVDAYEANATALGIAPHTLAVLEDPMEWNQLKLDIPDAFKGRKVTVRFILQTSDQRLFAGTSRVDDILDGSADIRCRSEPLLYFTCDATHPRTDRPWALDDIRVRTRTGTVYSGAPLFEDNGDDAFAKAATLAKFVNCAPAPSVESAESAEAFVVRSTREPYCRGWNVTHFGVESGKDLVKTYASYRYPTLWHLESTQRYVPVGQKDATLGLRWGLLGANDYPRDRIVWTSASTPTFSLASAQEPVLSFVTNYTFQDSRGSKYAASTFIPYCDSNSLAVRPGLRASSYVRDGGQVWITGLDAVGRPVVHELLIPEDGYDDGISMTPCGVSDSSGVFRHLPEGQVLLASCPSAAARSLLMGCNLTGVNYDHTPVKNAFSGRSGDPPGEATPSLWVEKRFDLKKYTSNELRHLTYRIEFHATKQTAKHHHLPGMGWAIDDIRVSERALANDVGVSAILSPADGRLAGPAICSIDGVERDLGDCIRKDKTVKNAQTIVAVVSNYGLYAQNGINVSVEILKNGEPSVITYRKDPTIDYAARPDAPLVPVTRYSISTGFAAADQVPGTLSDNPERNRTRVFPIEWMPTEEGFYEVVIWTDLDASESEAFAYLDENPLNDAFTRTVEVRKVRSVRVAPAVDDLDSTLQWDTCRAVFSDAGCLGYVGAPATFSIPVQNVGSYPEEFDPSLPRERSFYLEIDVRREGTGVSDLPAPIVLPIYDLPAGQAQIVTVPRGWVPRASGVYEVVFRLHHPAETVTLNDNLRRIKFDVFDNVVPAPDQNLTTAFVPEAPWWFDPKSGDAGAWRFSEEVGYGPDLNASLTLLRIQNLRSTRNLKIVLNHSYDFEHGYDGGLLEVGFLKNGKIEWRPIVPDGGYPDSLTSAAEGDPRVTKYAFTGTSDGFVNDTFDFAQFNEVVTPGAIVFNDTFLDKTNLDLVRYPQLTGTYRNDSYETHIVKPRSGNGLLFSDKSALLCASITGSSSPTSVVNNPAVNTDFLSTDPNRRCQSQLNAQAGNPTPAMSDGYAETAKNISRHFQLGPVEPGSQLVISFHDWRGLGLIRRLVGPGNNFDPREPIEPNAAVVMICCDGGGNPIELIPATTYQYNDNYRDWSINVKEIGVAQLDVTKPLALTFSHHVAVGIAREGAITGRSADTDTISNHYGWAIDDVRVEIRRPNGAVVGVFYESFDDLACHPNPSNGCGPNPALPTGWEWTGGYVTKMVSPSTGEVVHVQTSNRSAWRVAPQVGQPAIWSESDQPGVAPPLCYVPWNFNGASPIRWLDVGRGFCAMNAVFTAHNGEDIPYQGYSTKKVAHPTPGVTAGGAGRYITPVDLKAAVGDVEMSFDTRYKLKMHSIELGGELQQEMLSCARVEISTDGGTTWEPQVPNSGTKANGAPLKSGTTLNLDRYSPSQAVHSHCAGKANDPEFNSPFGFPSVTFVDSGSSCRDAACRFTYDLTRYAGKEVLVAWHVAFGTASSSIGSPTGGDNTRLPDFFHVSNILVTANVLDAGDVLVRFRAFSDSSVQGEGWAIQDFRMIGVKHLVNAATRVAAPNPESYYLAGEDVQVEIDVLNKGQKPLKDVKLTVRVEKVDGLGRVDPDTWREFKGTLSQFRACNGRTFASDVIPVSTDYRLCDFREASVFEPMKVKSQGAHAFRVTSFIEHAHDRPVPGEDFEMLVGDNRPPPLVVASSHFLSASRPAITAVNAKPSAYNVTHGDPFEFDVEVMNDGIAALVITQVNVRIDGPLGTTGALEDPIDLDLDDLVNGASPVLRNSRETRRFSWSVPYADLANHTYGIYRLQATVHSPQGAAHRNATFYLGNETFRDLVFMENGTRQIASASVVACEKNKWCGTVEGTRIDGPPHPFATPPSWGEGSEASGFAAPKTDSGIVHTPEVAYVIPEQNLIIKITDQQGQKIVTDKCNPPPTDPVCSPVYSVLATPLIDANRFVGPEGGSGLVSYFERRQDGLASSSLHHRVYMYVLGYTNEGLLKTDSAILVADLSDLHGRETPQFATRKFVARTVDISEAVQQARLVEGVEAIRVAFVARIEHGGQRFGGWWLDDFRIGPYGATLRSDEEAYISDNVDKTFRFVMRNAGGVRDAYTFHFADADLRPSTIPPAWNVTIVDPAGRILSQSGAPVASDLCPPGRERDRIKALSLEPGDEAIIGVRICIPTVANLAGKLGSLPFPVTAVSVTDNYTRSEVKLRLNYEYLKWSNLVVDPPRLAPEDASLPPGQPRAVEVTVRNKGLLEARDVTLDVEDRNPDAPQDLRMLDGSEIPVIPVIPVDESRTLTLRWTPLSAGEHDLAAIADLANSVVELSETDNVGITRVNVLKAAFPDLQVEVRTSNDQPNVGEAVWIDAAITNNGGVAASSIRVALKVGATDLVSSLDGSPFVVRLIEPGETVHVNRTWRALFPGKTVIFASAIPLSGIRERVDTQGNNIRALPVLVRSLGIDIAWRESAITAKPGAAPTGHVLLSNSGEAADTFDVRIEGPPGVRGFVYENDVRVTSVTLRNGTSADLTILVDLPSRLEAGNGTLKFVARSQNTTESRENEVILVVEPVYGLSLASGSASLKPGLRDVQVVIRNLGNARDRVTVAASSLPMDWAVASRSVVVEPYGRAVVNLSVKTPSSAAPAVYELLLVATGEKGFSSRAVLAATVVETDVLAPFFDSDSVLGRPQTVLTVPVVVRNIGNIRGEASLAVEAPPGWTASLARPALALGAGAETEVPLRVLVPVNATRGASYPLVVAASNARGVERSEVTVEVGAADLLIDEFSFAPRVNLKPGMPINVTAVVKNSGRLEAENVSVALYVDDSLVGFHTIPHLEPEASKTVRFEWVAVAGDHAFLAIADANNVHAEGDEQEANNARLEVVRVGAEGGLLGAAANAVPGLHAIALVGLVALAAFLVRRRR